MLTILELRKLRASLDARTFEAQLGPFVVIQKPPDEEEIAKAMELGASSTRFVPRGGGEAEDFAVLLEFDRLHLATLPQVGRDDLLTIGRLPDNELVLDDVSVSKRHAQLRWSDGRCVVQDLGSTNGTFLNEREVGREGAEVRDTDILKLGTVRCAFLLTSTLYRLMAAPPGPGSTVPQRGLEPKTLLAPLDGKLAALAEEHRRRANAPPRAPGADSVPVTRKLAPAAVEPPRRKSAARPPAPERSEEPTQISRVALPPDDAEEKNELDGDGPGEVTRRTLLKHPELDVTVARPMFTAELAAELRAEAEAEARAEARRKRSTQRGSGPRAPVRRAEDTPDSDPEGSQRFDPPKKR